MKMIKFFIIGVLFGIVLIKAEVVSWFRIQEMFHFQSIHMYGIIGCAVGVGAVTVILKRIVRAVTVSPMKWSLARKSRIGRHPSVAKQRCWRNASRMASRSSDLAQTPVKAPPSPGLRRCESLPPMNPNLRPCARFL